MIDRRRLFWTQISETRLTEILININKSNKIIEFGIHFPVQNLRLNVRYNDQGFDELLSEKFSRSVPYTNVPSLTFINSPSQLLERLGSQNGYLHHNGNHAIVFATNFGLFKSAISGFASYCVRKQGYVPIHASVLRTSKRGIAFVGGSMAGKTTTLINVANYLLSRGEKIEVLTDDWAIVNHHNMNFYFAETFDPFISLKLANLMENLHIRFNNQESILENLIRRESISRRPSELYGLQAIDAERIYVDTMVMLRPISNDEKLSTIDSEEFAQEITSVAYHYPYADKNLLEDHKNFWMRSTDKINTFCFYTRSRNGNFQSILPIEQLF